MSTFRSHFHTIWRFSNDLIHEFLGWKAPSAINTCTSEDLSSKASYCEQRDHLQTLLSFSMTNGWQSRKQYSTKGVAKVLPLGCRIYPQAHALLPANVHSKQRQLAPHFASPHYCMGYRALLRHVHGSACAHSSHECIMRVATIPIKSLGPGVQDPTAGFCCRRLGHP